MLFISCILSRSFPPRERPDRSLSYPCLTSLFCLFKPDTYSASLAFSLFIRSSSFLASRTFAAVRSCSFCGSDSFLRFPLDMSKFNFSSSVISAVFFPVVSIRAACFCKSNSLFLKALSLELLLALDFG